MPFSGDTSMIMLNKCKTSNYHFYLLNAIRHRFLILIVILFFSILEPEWQKIEHTFSNYPRGTRYVFFQHSGKDEQFWAGHYGSKMAKASVIVSYGNGKRRFINR